MKNRKIRGARRIADRIIREIEANTTEFPETDFFENDCWHLEIPGPQKYLRSERTPKKEKRRCLQSMIDRAEYLIQQRPEQKESFKIMVVLDIGDLWSSQIIVGTRDADFDRFIYPINPNLRRIKQPDYNKLNREWGLTIPDHWSLTGFREFIREKNEQLEGEIWFIAQ
ncbi:hypothetical protein ASD24_29655 [Paenibacillus sp. Root52]|uniref:DUF3916 domain-containing protein n=1 Tax=Paenibacillus sp. Root52 TaxID=1736552 RepID=UPI0006FC9F53|nr:DUF3916 domain-containing protein [Paenibacillus sp. Root52]KQY83605.1 hypothetical protein ASD24_29655 [Paenibacillus sp. Root52]